MASNDYERIAAAIEYCNRNFLQQPGLDDIARAVHLSPFHFQRLFRRWAGVSPKRFLQFLTAARARTLLGESKPTLEAALDLGLSSSSRLHDLMLTVHAATPGELQSGGAGLTLATGEHESIFGLCQIALTSRGVCWLSFASMKQAREEIREYWPNARIQQDRRTTARVAASLTSGPLNLHVFGSNFQIRVWEALLRIPCGQVSSYEDVAAEIGKPTATRAVASAVARNQIAWLIPCHRVIRKSGVFGQYRWEPLRKQTMLAWEFARNSS
jgi:AraC family transcriptional regulator of adaptative response/methylated-DNA-[protein]-cysteine methyltransferase